MTTTVSLSREAVSAVRKTAIVFKNFLLPNTVLYFLVDQFVIQHGRSDLSLTGKCFLKFDRKYPKFASNLILPTNRTITVYGRSGFCWISIRFQPLLKLLDWHPHCHRSVFSLIVLALLTQSFTIPHYSDVNVTSIWNPIHCNVCHCWPTHFRNHLMLR